MSSSSSAAATPSARVAVVSGGLGAYWPQFAELRPALETAAGRLRARLAALGAEVTDVGFVSAAEDADGVVRRVRELDPDLLVVNVATYLTSSMILPIAQRAGCPVLVVDLQPTAHMDHERVDTGGWLAYCGQCAVPELGNTFRRAGIGFRSVTGHLEHEPAWERIGRWVRAAGAHGTLRSARHGLMGHLYPGMLDVSTDLTRISTTFGSHVEVLELDDLRERVPAEGDGEVVARVDEVRRTFELDATVDEQDLDWAARVSIGLDRLASDFRLGSLAYYHRGLGGELHERLGAGMILGATLLTARGVPAAGEYELRTSVAMLVASHLAGGGSFTEIQALDFSAGVVEMGHDGPADLRVAAERPILRGLPVFHGKRGWGVSVELTVAHGPATCLGLGQEQDGSLTLLTSEGTVVDGPRMRIGNTTSRVDFGVDPGVWVDAWSASGVGHHWALVPGHVADDVAALAQLAGVEHRACRPV
ncbi:L-arabinose isomerase [Beutenbergia cavernae DSM 12333]|uniref:L-arabinose isomerase n=1 Tax=Beutenbergia cavernae (strain ATCC BAA-8 / DSM 12333 / CCUG 43141 / JCM 11478 / NBRC 16432 / NCIMB 13614 / HKI 0122) TaxID=471853 RepID=C5C314_BEUC1|nr:L-fucose/L-arabinose isomerase family protein [Beutenbergia cavernae]ACQ81858.1 L-arabinose isomerase [Beutenbergia cavernae DSM 12333]